MMNSTGENPPNLGVLLDVPVNLTVQLGSCHMPLRDVLQLGPASVVQLDQMADDPVHLSVNNKLVAKGEVVVVEGKFGIKITEMLNETVAE